MNFHFGGRTVRSQNENLADGGSRRSRNCPALLTVPQIPVRLGLLFLIRQDMFFVHKREIFVLEPGSVCGSRERHRES